MTTWTRPGWVKWAFVSLFRVQVPVHLTENAIVVGRFDFYQCMNATTCFLSFPNTPPIFFVWEETQMKRSCLPQVVSRRHLSKMKPETTVPSLFPLSRPPFSIRTASRASASCMNWTKPYPRSTDTAATLTRITMKLSSRDKFSRLPQLLISLPDSVLFAGKFPIYFSSVTKENFEKLKFKEGLILTQWNYSKDNKQHNNNNKKKWQRKANYKTNLPRILPYCAKISLISSLSSLSVGKFPIKIRLLSSSGSSLLVCLLLVIPTGMFLRLFCGDLDLDLEWLLECDLERPLRLESLPRRPLIASSFSCTFLILYSSSAAQEVYDTLKWYKVSLLGTMLKTDTLQWTRLHRKMILSVKKLLWYLVVSSVHTLVSERKETFLSSSIQASFDVLPAKSSNQCVLQAHPRHNSIAYHSTTPKRTNWTVI